jgi:carbamoyl-phosphate synthase large subunit
VRANLRTPNPFRLLTIRTALLMGFSAQEIAQLTHIDPWFIDKLQELVEVEQALKGRELGSLSADDLRHLKQMGFSDRQIAHLTGSTEHQVRACRKSLGVIPTYKTVDTCAAEFEAATPYQYSTYESESEIFPARKEKVMILGGGPNRIGQGIEFDYCCCHAAFALSRLGYEAIMVNSNPETVSTDYDTADRLYFEPLTHEEVMNLVDAEQPVGLIVQFGGQTPLKLAQGLAAAQAPIWGTSPDSIDIAEDRGRFERILRELDIRQPANGIARSVEESLEIARRIGYPVVVRPSYVLGGRAMEIVYSDQDLQRYMQLAVAVDPDRPVLVDQFLEEAVEVDVDAIADRTGAVTIGGILEHIEQAGIHSGDSACVLPSRTLSPDVLRVIRQWTVKLAQALKVVGLINVQYAVQKGQVYILEANPRASRTVPFVSKAIGHPLADYAAQVMSGKTLEELGFTQEVIPSHIAVKEAVLPFHKFPGTDTLLGPEMRSTGEVMGIDTDFGRAYAKAQLAAGQNLPLQGTVFISVSDRDKQAVIPVAREFVGLGFRLLATEGTQKVLAEHGIPVDKVLKLHEGRPHVIDAIKNHQIQLIINTPSGVEAQQDGQKIRRTALAYKIPLVTTLAGAKATAAAIRALQSGSLQVKCLQDFFSV